MAATRHRSEHPGAANQRGLRRDLGLLEVTAGGIGMIIGAGIYVLIGSATAQAGAGVWLSFVLAALLCGLTGLSYAELTSMYPSAGAEYEYTRHVFPAWVATVVGLTMIAAFLVAAAAVALGFAHYLALFLPLNERLAGLLLLATVAAIGSSGVRQAARLTLMLSAVQVGGLLLVIAIGLPHLGRVNLLQTHGLGGVLGAAALVFFAFIGFDDINTLAEETRNPTATIPRALLLALSISAALYVLVGIAAVSTLGAERLGASATPLADVMSRAVGSRSGDVVALIALVSTTNTTLVALTAGSRLLYAMAAGGALPRGLADVHPRHAVPLRALGVCLLAAAAFVLLDNLTLVASVTDYAVYTVFLAVNATVILSRLREPGAVRPFRVPLSVRGVPVLPVLGLGAVLLMLAQLEGSALAIGGGLTALLVLFALLRGGLNPARSR